MSGFAASAKTPDKSFDDTDDFLKDFMGGEILPAEHISLQRPSKPVEVKEVPLVHTEKCPACNGTGLWRGIRSCFKCKGKGSKTYKTSRATRDNAKLSREQRKEDNLKTFSETYPAEAAWMLESTNFDFAVKMIEAVKTYGDLTPGQLAAVQRCVAKAETRKQAKAAERQTYLDSAPVVIATPFEDAFKTAIERGIKRPKMNIDSFHFSLASSTSRNPGAIYAKNRETGDYLGKIHLGKFVKSSFCTPEQEKQIVEIAQDPKAAAIAYGQRSGNCSCCGRELTNHASIDAGIGPICASKMGW